MHWSRNHWLAVVAVVAIVLAGTAVVYWVNWSNELLVCPGCNPPETLRLDHYTIKNNTSQKPSLLTIWFASTGPAGKTLSPQALYITNGPTKYPGCHWIPYNESSCLTSYPITGVTIPALSVVPVTIDTSSSGFYFAAGEKYSIDAQTDKYWFGGFQVAYPPESLAPSGYTIGYDSNQANATVLTLWLTNRGNTMTTLSAVTLQDSMGNANPVRFPMNGPTISRPGDTVQATLDTLNSGFYFTHTHFYTLTITPSTGATSTSTINFP